jgi:FtsP/CotA-like multicopper oxidase with cupredoxin domain
MRTRMFTLRFGATALTYASLALTGTSALGAEYWLKAGTTTVNPPGASTPVAMWGYALCGTGSTMPAGWPATCSGTVSVPGPALTVPEADASLTVHLANGLAVPTSLVINGLIKPMAPVWTEPGSAVPLSSRGGSTSARVRSFDAEAAPSNGTALYTWLNVKPGTYLYQSGTQPQVQVQMGLYGAVTKNAVDAAGSVRAQAYPGVAYEYDNQAPLLYSEIDPDLHAAVATGKYGVPCPAATPDCGNPTSTINYAPKYFLINGQPYPHASLIIAPAGNPGTTLLRLLNAGLTTHVPMIQGNHWTVVAEDGKPYPYRSTQYTALLPAAKTVDVLLTPDIGGAVYSIMDRRLSLSNNGLSDGGMLAFLQYSAQGAATGSPGNAVPTAADHAYPSIVGVTLNVDAGAGLLLGALDGDNLPLPLKAVAASGPTACTGTYALNANGSFTYVPPAAMPALPLPAGCTASSDTFKYQVTDGNALSAQATVTINLTEPPPPTFVGIPAVDDFERVNAPSLGVNWDQQTGSVASAPDIGITGGKANANSTALGGLAIWKADFGTKQGAAFEFGGVPPAKAYLVLKASGGTAVAPANYVRVGCEAGQVVVYTMMGGSNVSAYVKQATLGACSVGALSAVVDEKGLVTAFAGGAFAGGVQLPNVAAWKGGGRIGIQLTSAGATADNFAGGNVP